MKETAMILAVAVTSLSAAAPAFAYYDDLHHHWHHCHRVWHNHHWESFCR
jgi:hypothetical protein